MASRHFWIVPLLAAALVLAATAPLEAQGKSKGKGKGLGHSQAPGLSVLRGQGGNFQSGGDAQGGNGRAQDFGLRVAGEDFDGTHDFGGLPPGLGKRHVLPPGLAMKDVLPPGLLKGHRVPPGLAMKSELPFGLSQ